MKGLRADEDHPKSPVQLLRDSFPGIVPKTRVKHLNTIPPLNKQRAVGQISTGVYVTALQHHR